MELRTLRYFLAVAQAKTISAAAEALHVTQPTLSRQMQELEEELGKTLFLRGKRSITLTEEGTFFRKRAQEVVSLLEKTTAELKAPDELLSGDIHIGGGETDAIRLIVRAARRMRQDHPHVTFHIFSGNAEDVMEKIDRDLVDFGLFIEPVDLSGYEFFRLPVKDRWGVLMRKDAPLAARPSVAPADLRGLPLLVSRQNMVNNEVAGWLGETHDALQVVATYNLLYSASIMVEEGMGYALCLDRIIRLPEDGPLCFRPLHPAMEVGLNVAWKKTAALLQTGQGLSGLSEGLALGRARRERSISGRDATRRPRHGIGLLAQAWAHRRPCLFIPSARKTGTAPGPLPLWRRMADHPHPVQDGDATGGPRAARGELICADVEGDGRKNGPPLRERQASLPHREASERQAPPERTRSPAGTAARTAGRKRTETL